jgi:patatin-like phospholipase/acyl hydrolase
MKHNWIQIELILNFVGGGARGLITARILQRMVEAGIIVITKETILAGTSTGAIIAALLAKGFTPAQICDFYIEHGPSIFDKEFLRFGITRSKYDDSEFNRLLKEYLGNTTLGELNKKGVSIIIPTYNASKRKRFIFRSTNPKYAGMRLRDVVRASAAAPTYFDPAIIDGDYHIDGGTVINNPSKASLIDTVRCGKMPKTIITIGTGRIEEPFTKKELEGGLVGCMEKLVDMMLAEQDKSVDFEMREDSKIFGYEYLRIDPKIKHSSGDIDDFKASNIENMLKDANETIIHT